MSIDLSNLQLVQENIEVADDAQYIDATAFPPPIPEGVYTFIQGKPEFSANKDKFLTAVMTHTVAGGAEDGKTLAFDRVSNKPFERSGVKVNMMKDQIRAVYPQGSPERDARTHEQYADALAAAEGKPFKAEVQWEGGCNHKDTEHECDWSDKAVFRVKYQKNFAGKDSVACPTCGADVMARAKINMGSRRSISAS